MLWWYYVFYPVLQLVLVLLIAQHESPQSQSPNVPGYEALVLLEYAISFALLAIFGRRPSANSVKNILLGHIEENPLTQHKTGGLYYSLRLGMWGLIWIPFLGTITLLMITGVREPSFLVPFSYFLILLGYIALIAHRLRATRIVRNALKEIDTKSR